jgi:hypothetical protein
LNFSELEYYGTEEGDTSVDVVHRSIPNTPSPQHLEVYWDANDSNSYSFANSSNVYDLSGSGVKGTITGNNGFDAEYNAWVFDGSGDYISGTLNNPAGDWVHSVSCWVSATELSSNKARFISYYGVEALRQQVILYLTTGRIYVDFNSDSIYKDVSPFVLNTWYHIAFTYSGGGTSNVKIYINGVDVGASGGGTTALNIASGQTLYVGKELNLTYNDPWKGSIANFRLFGKALNADQVRELYEYDAPRFGHRQNLVALHKGNLGVGVAHPTSRFEVAGADGLQEYPPRGMTGYETYMEGHGVFRAGGSSDNYNSTGNSSTSGTYAEWRVFDHDRTTDNAAWLSYPGTYSSTLPSVTAAKINDVSGEYVYIETPHEIKLHSFNISVRGQSTGEAGRMPTDGIIWGKNDGGDWQQVFSWSGQVYSTSDGTEITTFIVNSESAYKMYALQVTKIQSGGSDATAIGELRLFGTPAPSSLDDGHLTLGKALTLPRVSGHPAGAETPRAESLVVHYDTTVDSVVSGTTVVDISGEGNNGSFNGNATYSSTDRAFTFDGTGDYVEASINNSAGEWLHSVSMWFKQNTNDSYDTLFHLGEQSSGKCISLRLLSSGVLRYNFYDGDIETSSVITLNTWYHLAFTYSGGTDIANRKIYLNGVELALVNNSGTPVVLNLDANDKFTLATQSQPIEGEMNCNISNFKIWGGVALTAEEVAMEYALGRTGKSLNVTDTALCLGGTVPRAQLDVRGTGMFDGGLVIKYKNSLEYARDGGIMMSRAGLGNATNKYSSQPIILDGGDSGAIDGNLRGGAIWSQWGGSQYGIAIRGASLGDTYPYLQDPALFVTKDKVGIGTVSPAGSRLHVYNPTTTSRVVIERGSDSGEVNLTLKSSHSSGGTEWQIYHAGATANLIFWRGVDRGYFRYNGANTAQNFTGQHRTFIKDVPFTEAEALEGLIVSSDQNKYIKMSGGIAAGSNAITTNESLPVVSLSTKVNDKKCFGVVSTSEDPETREEQYGNFVSVSEKELGDTRVYINSVGEGAMWVVNTAGALESGDYITTSNVAGYGQRQDDDILHNYTVAKITMDCDFNPPDIPVQRIVKELSNITYWFQLEDATSNAYDRTEEETYYTKDRRVEVYGAVDEQSNVFVPPDHDLELYSKTQVNTVSEEVYDALPADEQALYDSNTFTYTQVIEVSPEVWEDLEPEEQNTYVHRYYKIYVDEVPMETPDAVERTRTVYKKVVNDTKVEPSTPEDYLSEVRDEWVNVLDEHGQLQWEDVPWGETEPAYKIRYLDASGNLTTRHNAVHLAAFVGVTYHCG